MTEPNLRKLPRAKAYIRGEGWTIKGNQRSGYEVSQLGDRRRLSAWELLEFAGMAGEPQPVTETLLPPDREPHFTLAEALLTAPDKRTTAQRDQINRALVQASRDAGAWPVSSEQPRTDLAALGRFTRSKWDIRLSLAICAASATLVIAAIAWATGLFALLAATLRVAD